MVRALAGHLPHHLLPIVPGGTQTGHLHEPVESDIPTLVVAGTLDPITPPKGSRFVTNLPNSTYVVLDEVGHGAVAATECGVSIAVDFLGDPTAQLDTTCAHEFPGTID